MGNARLKWLATPLLVACLVLTWVGTASAQKSPYHPAPKRDELSASEQAGCPPHKPGEAVPAINEDRVNRDGTTDYFMGEYHWDDGEGNDLTLKEWCMHGEVPYFSVELIQSKNGANTTVANPLGTGGAVETDGC